MECKGHSRHNGTEVIQGIPTQAIPVYQNARKSQHSKTPKEFQKLSTQGIPHISNAKVFK